MDGIPKNLQITIKPNETGREVRSGILAARAFKGIGIDGKKIKAAREQRVKRTDNCTESTNVETSLQKDDLPQTSPSEVSHIQTPSRLPQRNKSFESPKPQRNFQRDSLRNRSLSYTDNCFGIEKDASFPSAGLDVVDGDVPWMDCVNSHSSQIHDSEHKDALPPREQNANASQGSVFGPYPKGQSFKESKNDREYSKPEWNRFRNEPEYRRNQNRGGRPAYSQNRKTSSGRPQNNWNSAQKSRASYLDDLKRNDWFPKKAGGWNEKVSHTDKEEIMPDVVKSSISVPADDDIPWNDIEDIPAPVSEGLNSKQDEETSPEKEIPSIESLALSDDASTKISQSSSSEQTIKDQDEKTSSTIIDCTKPNSSPEKPSAEVCPPLLDREESPARKLLAVSQLPALRRPMGDSLQHLPVTARTPPVDVPKVPLSGHQANSGVLSLGEGSHPNSEQQSGIAVIEPPVPLSKSLPSLAGSDVPFQKICQTREESVVERRVAPERSISLDSSKSSYDSGVHDCPRSSSVPSVEALESNSSMCIPTMVEASDDSLEQNWEESGPDDGLLGSDLKCSEDSEEPKEFPPEQIEAISSVLRGVLGARAGTEVDVQTVKKDINNVLTRFFQGCKVKVYGSHYAGYALSTSDINLEFYSKAEYFNKKFMREIATTLEKCKKDYYVTYEDIENKVVCIEPQCGTSCVIRHLGPDSPYYKTSKLIRQILDTFEPTRTLVIALRHWAEVCLVNGPEEERLHPLVLVMMVIYFLQRHKPSVVPIINIELPMKEHKLTETNQQEVGFLWICLLRFYAEEFIWREHVVSITKSAVVWKKDKSWKKYWIAVEAPFVPELNLAKNVRSQDIANYIQNCFAKSYKYFSSVPPNGFSSKGSCCSESSSSASDGGFNDEKQPSEYYSFDPANLVAENANIPRSCVVCDDLGYMCEECVEEDNDLQEFPAMAPEDLIPINTALKEAYSDHALMEKDIKTRVLFVKDLQYYINRKFHDAVLQLIGSSTNGFGFRNSDLDICMTFKGRYKMSPYESKQKLKDLCYHLRRNDEYTSVFALYSAKIPIIQFLHAKTGYRCDISLYNTLAVYNTNLLHTYSRIDERAKILGCCLKLLAKKACIADTSQKSLSSYSYVLMAIHYLQRTSPPILPALQQLVREGEEKVVEGCNVAFFSDLNSLDKVWKREENTASIGELWLDLLKYYIMDIDVDQVISIRHGQVIPHPPTFRRARMFNIEDPFISIKNLGSVMSQSMSIRTYRTFVRARKLFGTPIKELPPGFSCFKDYYFDEMSLTDGAVTNSVECELCGKPGHTKEKCRRFNNIFSRGRPNSNFSRGRLSNVFRSKGSFGSYRGHPSGRGGPSRPSFRGNTRQGYSTFSANNPRY